MAREYLLYGSNTTLGWNVVRRISFERGETLTRLHKVHRVYDDFGAHAGYQMVDETKLYDTLLPSREGSSAAITARESEANSGVCGESATADLPERKRIHRLHTVTGKLLPAEDFIERAQCKVAMQTSTANHDSRGDRAVRAYPKG